MLRKYLFIFFLLGFLGFTQAQIAPKNVSLVGHLPYSNTLSDVWAYVDSTGHEYALVGVENGFSIVDLIDPSNPTELQFIPGATTIWRDCIVYGDYAYVSNEGAGGTLIMDLSTLPGQVMYKDTILNNIPTAHNIWEHDGYLYLIGGNFTNGLDIFDLKNDPWNPAYVGSYNNAYVHDVYIRNDTAYAAEINDGFLTILDVSNKSNIRTLGSRTYNNPQTHNTWLNTKGDVCISTDELGSGYLISWDVSDPTDIKELDRIRSSLSEGTATPHNAHFLNDFIITSYYADGLHIVDANRPSNLVEVGHYDTSPTTGPGFVGCWGAYPFLPSGLTLAADIELGLYVLQPTYVRAAYLEGNITDANTNNPISGVEVRIENLSTPDFSTNLGDYATGLPDAGTYTVTYRKYGYEPQSRMVSMVNGQVSIENVVLTPSSPTPLVINVIEKGSNMPIPGAEILITAVGASFDATADANGQYSKNDFLTGTYDVIVGSWGHVTTLSNFDLLTGDGPITLELEKGYYDDFLFDNKWLVDAGATTGNFELGIPLGTGFGGFYFNPNQDLRDDFGDKAYVTGNQGIFPFDDELSGGYTTLVSPPMDLSSYSDPIIEFHFWMINLRPEPNGFTAGNDTLKVELIGIGSAVIMEIDSVIANNWNKASFYVKDFINPSANMRIRFSAADGSPEDLLEIGIDGFQVREGDSTVAIDQEIVQKIDLSVFPIPAQDEIFVRYDLSRVDLQGDLSFEILDIQGKSLRRNAIHNRSGQLQLDFDLPSGMYLGVLRLDGEVLSTRKIVK